MITTMFRDVQFLAQDKPVMRDNKPEFFGKIMFMGGTVNVRNPDKIKTGPYAEMVVETRLQQGAVLKEFDGKSSARSSTAVYFGAVVASKITK